MSRALKNLLRWAAWSWLVLAVVCAALFVGWLALGAPQDSITFVIDDDTLTVPAMSVGGWLLAFGGALLALLIVVVVVPLALLIGLAVPTLLLALGLGLGGVLLAGALAVAASPLLLPALLVWWLWRRDARRNAPASTTIAA